MDAELDRLLEEFDNARRRLETRTPLIEEALVELAHIERITLDGYMGFGRTFKVTDGVRAELEKAAQAELAELREEVAKSRGAVMTRREETAVLPPTTSRQG